MIRHWRHNASERRSFEKDVQTQFERAVQERLEKQQRQAYQQRMELEKTSQFRTPTITHLPAIPIAMAAQARQVGLASQTHVNSQTSKVQRSSRIHTRQTDGMSPPLQWQRNLQLRLEIGTGWDAGIKRKQQPNEDSMVAFQGTCIYNNALVPFGLLVVADGMGGHAAGQEASYLAVQAMVQWVVPHIAGVNAMSDELLTELLVDGVRQSNLAVYQRSQEVGADMGTTITAALVLDSRAYIINVGDSRTYLYRASEGLRQVTHDHSLVARLVAAGRITPDEVYTHPDRNQVYRGLGDKCNVEVDSFSLPLLAHDRLLLCSDGLWEMVRDPEIARILQQQDWNPAQKSKALIQSALNGGGLDNISAIVAHITPITL